MLCAKAPSTLRGKDNCCASSSNCWGKIFHLSEADSQRFGFKTKRLVTVFETISPPKTSSSKICHGHLKTADNDDRIIGNNIPYPRYVLACVLSCRIFIDLFCEVLSSQGQTNKIPKGRRKHQPYYFPTLDSTLDQRCLPLGYAFFGKEPDPELACDDPACEVVADEHDIFCLNCGHTFHRGCFLKNSSDEEHSYALLREEMKCAVCYEPLCERMEELATSLNRYLAGDGDDMDAVEPEEEEDNDDDPEEADDEESSFDKNHFYKQVLNIQQKAVSRFSDLPHYQRKSMTRLEKTNQIDEQIRKSIEGINLHSHVLPCSSDYKPETASTEGINLEKPI
ncbi:uncharacterized protein LOC122955171 [Acropora millepora]|uniref:uncharacterized protein LOC122955171 n=1 Tax=Acropora millepora TaxID=45264 RepID=UPI001CF29CEC|nr:uncharacterized protein LOC122955171 [Acropora millepora]